MMLNFSNPYTNLIRKLVVPNTFIFTKISMKTYDNCYKKIQSIIQLTTYWNLNLTSIWELVSGISTSSMGMCHQHGDFSAVLNPHAGGINCRY